MVSGSTTRSTAGAVHTRLGASPVDGEAGQAGGAEGRADLAAGAVAQRAIERGGQDAAPERAAGAAADHRDLADIRVPGAQRVLAVGQREGDAFEHGAAEVGARRGVPEAEEHAARVRVVVRRALAGQVGKKDDAGLAVRRLDLGQQRRFAAGGRDGGDPGEATGGAQDHRHLVPGRRQAVAERVHGARWVGRVGGVRHEVDAGGAERQEGVAGARPRRRRPRRRRCRRRRRR